MEKYIKNFEDYAITSDGKVISYKYKQPRIMATTYQIHGGYENIRLMKNGVGFSKLIHRLVAQAFIPNPNNLPEVNHKDRDVKNNKMDNLEWCDRRYNVEHSSLGFVRNFYNCYIEEVATGNRIKEFNTISAASLWASENLDCSKTYLQRKTGNISNGYRIIKEKGVETIM